MTVEALPPPQECWPVDHSCCPDYPETPPAPDTPEALLWERADALAIMTLRMLTAYRVGGCPVTVLPCKQSCVAATYQGFPVGYGGSGAWTPVLRSGTWVNIGCGCGHADCSCGVTQQVRLDGVPGTIAEVRLGGTTLDPTAYRVDGSWLTRLDGDSWPTCQDLAADPPAFAVDYTPGAPVDGMGAYAAGLLACEYAKACSGEDCALPPSVVSVARQGVTYTFRDKTGNAFPGGMTGIQPVDAWVRRWNPHGLSTPPAVWSPDLPHPRVVG